MEIAVFHRRIQNEVFFSDDRSLWPGNEGESDLRKVVYKKLTDGSSSQ